MQRDRVEGDLDEELRSSLEFLIDEKVRAGMALTEARRAAAVELRIEPIKERVRDVRTGVTMETLLQDVRYAWRHVRRSPGFALAAVLTLAFGIGANTAMFSMLSALTMQRLAVEDPDGLIAVAPKTSRGLARSTPVSAVDHLEDGPLDYPCGYLGQVILPVLANRVAVETSTTFITGRCLDAFGVRPILGRGIEERDAPLYGPGARGALISHRLWTSAFASDPSLVGKTLSVNNVEVSIIGVLPRGFVGLEVDSGVDVFTTFDSVLPAGRTRRQLASYILGRLPSGVTMEQAAAEIETRWPAILDAVLPATLAPSEREQLRDSTARLERLGTGVSRNRDLYVRPLTLILALTTLLLMLACVNLGGLLLARLTGRRAELSVRLALGGTRWRIAQQMLIESLVLSLAGAVLAIPLTYAIVVTLVSFMPPTNLPQNMSFTPNGQVLIMTGLVGVIVGLAMSALPVWIAMRRRGGAHFTWDRTIVGTTSHWGRALLVAQVALSVLLLSGAALLTRSLYLLQTNELGVRTADILEVSLAPRPEVPENRADRASYYPLLLEKVAALPSLRSVALAEVFPRARRVTGFSPTSFVGEEQNIDARIDDVSPAFFRTLGIRLLAGRDVSWADTLQTRRVAVVSESLARALSPDLNVLERQIKWRTLPTEQVMTIVGVVADATQGDPRDARPRIIYRPYLQRSATSASLPSLLIDTSRRGDRGARRVRDSPGVRTRIRARDHRRRRRDRAGAGNRAHERDRGRSRWCACRRTRPYWRARRACVCRRAPAPGNRRSRCRRRNAESGRARHRAGGTAAHRAWCGHRHPTRGARRALVENTDVRDLRARCHDVCCRDRFLPRARCRRRLLARAASSRRTPSYGASRGVNALRAWAS